MKEGEESSPRKSRDSFGQAGDQPTSTASNNLDWSELTVECNQRKRLDKEEVQRLRGLLSRREYDESLELLLGYYYDGAVVDAWTEGLIPENITYRYRNKEVLDSADFYLYDISGIVILSYIIHCYICKNDIFGVVQLIKSFERLCFHQKASEHGNEHLPEADGDGLHLNSWCSSFSIRDVVQENMDTIKHELRVRRHVLRLIDIYYFFRVQVVFWKLAMYKTYHIPSISASQPESKHAKDLSESLKIEDYFVFYDQAVDELYVLVGEIDDILCLFRDHDEETVTGSWLLRYKVALLILVEALTLKDYYREAVQLLREAMRKHLSDDISLYSLIARISLQCGNFPLVSSTLNTIEELLQHPKHNTNVNIAHYRFTLGLLNMAQDDPVTASLNFNTSAALYKELTINLNKEYLLPCSTSLNNLSVASFYSSKLPNSVSILENQIFNQNNFFSNSQQLFATNFKNLKTLYQFSSDKDRLINELKKVSKTSLRYSILLN